MKRNSCLQRILFLLCIFCACLSLKAVPPSGPCCDSMTFFIVPASAYSDSCTGTLHFDLNSNTCGIVNFAVSGNNGPVVWDGGNSFHTAYRFAKGTTGFLTVYYLDSGGDTLCMKRDSVYCPPPNQCCDSLGFDIEPTIFYTDSCTGWLHFNTRPDCGITGYRINGSHGPIISEGGNQYRVRYGIATGTTGYLAVYYTDTLGDTVCMKSGSVYCPSGFSCCDSVSFLIEPANIYPDSCTGLLHFSVDSNACEITGFRVSGNNGPVVWDGGYNYHTTYGFTKGTKGYLAVYYLNTSGDTVCIKEDTVFCPADSCCKSFAMYIVPETMQDRCCGKVYFAIGPDVICPISNVLVSENINDLRWSDENQAYVGSYCLDKDQVTVLTGYFIDYNNDTICIKSDSLYCPKESDCCDNIQVIDYPLWSSEGCCGELHFWMDEHIPCDISEIWIDNEKYKPRGSVYPYCMPEYTSMMKTIYFIGHNGDTLCTKVWEKNCEGYSINQFMFEQKQSNLYPNPAQDKITVESGTSGMVSILIIDKSGVVVYEGRTLLEDGKLSIDTKDLPEGIYAVRLSNGKTNEIKKFLIRR